MMEIPDNVDNLTREFMKGVEERLEGNISHCDVANLWAMMCAFDNYVKSSKKIIEEGSVLYDKRGRGTINPHVRIAEKYYIQLHQIMKEYGLTLKSKENIKALASDIDEDNPLISFLKNGKI